MNGLRYPVTIERLPPMTVFEARGPEAELADAVAAAGLPWPAAFNDYALGADEADLIRLGPTVPTIHHGRPCLSCRSCCCLAAL